MIYCKNCGTPNSIESENCIDCGGFLKGDGGRESFSKTFSDSIDPDKIQRLDKEFKEAKDIDIMFVFDCTGSMSSEIDGMRKSIIGFATELQKESLGMRLGLIEFRDRNIGEESILHKFNGEVFTTDYEKFKSHISKLKATGGGPPPESSPDAIMLALEQKFRNIPNKTIVLITDAPPRIPDKDTPNIETVMDKIREKDINLFYIITKVSDSKCKIHLKFLEATQRNGGDGLVFPLSKKIGDREKDFQKILISLGKSISAKSRITTKT